MACGRCRRWPGCGRTGSRTPQTCRAGSMLGHGRSTRRWRHTKAWLGAHMYRSVLLGAVASLALTIGAAQAQTMEEALALTYKTNPQLSADRARQRATDEGVPRALSNWRPTVTVSGSAGKGRDRLRQENGVGTTIASDARRSPEVATLSVTQPLYRGGRTLAETSRA